MAAQCLEAAPKDGGRSEHAEELAECLIASRQNSEPETQQNVERGLYDERRQRCAYWRRGTCVCRRQPKMQRKKGRLESEARSHETERRPNCRRRLHTLSKRRNIDAAEAVIDQYYAEKIR